MKFCKECNKEFTPIRTTKIFCTRECKDKFKGKEFRINNPENYQKYLSKYKAEYHRKWREKNPNSNYNNHLKHTYNININDYNRIFSEQSGYCKICGKHQLELGKKRLCVDHDHKTNKVRGLLCEKCNHGLGRFEDNIQSLKKAIEYLEEQNTMK